MSEVIEESPANATTKMEDVESFLNVDPEELMQRTIQVDGISDRVIYMVINRKAQQRLMFTVMNDSLSHVTIRSMLPVDFNEQGVMEHNFIRPLRIVDLDKIEEIRNKILSFKQISVPLPIQGV